jgi:hypothetical protein
MIEVVGEEDGKIESEYIYVNLGRRASGHEAEGHDLYLIRG